MKKAIYILVFLLSVSSFANAQWSLGVSYQAGFTGKQMYSGDMGNSLLGVNAKLKYDFDDYVKFTLGAGYYMIPFDKIRVDETQAPVSDLSLSMIPVTVGMEFYFINQKQDVPQKYKPFFGIDLGWAYSIQPVSDLAPAKNRNNVIIAPSLGVAYVISDNLDLFASARHNIFIYQYRDRANTNATFSMLGINLGLNFHF